MKNFAITIVLITILSFFVASLTAQSCVKVDVSGFKNYTGKLHISVYSNQESFLKPGGELITKIVQIGDSSHLDTYICNLPPGWYAIALYQDMDDNNKMNTGFLGTPKEPYGLSNNIQPHFSFPKFTQCSFYVAYQQEKDVAIALVNPK